MLPNSPRSQKILLTCLGLFLTGVFLSPGRAVSTDIEARLLVTRGIWQNATPVVDRPFHGAVKVEGGWTNYYGMGQSLLLIPFDMGGVAISRALGLTGKSQVHAERLLVYFLFLPLVGVLWWLFSLRLMERLGFRFDTAYAGSLLFFLGTISYVYAFQSSQEEALVGLCLLASLCTLLDWEKYGSHRSLFLAGFIAGWAALVRLNFLTSLAPLGAVFLRGGHGRLGIREWAAGLSGFLVPLSLHFVFAHLRYGSPLATGYDLAAAQAVGGVQWIFPEWQMFLALLAGPGKGLLFLSPVLVFGFLGLAPWFRRDPALCVGTLVSLVASLVVSSAIYNNPDGSEAWGTRYQVHLVPLFCVPLWLAWKEWGQRTRTLVRGALALGMVINLSAAAYPWSLEYSQFDGDTVHRMGIISHPTQGQLASRLTNVVVPPSSARDFAPNVWAASYSRKTGSWMPAFFGGIILLLGIFCLRKAVRVQPPAPSPARQSQAA